MCGGDGNGGNSAVIFESQDPITIPRVCCEAQQNGSGYCMLSERRFMIIRCQSRHDVDIGFDSVASVRDSARGVGRAPVSRALGSTMKAAKIMCIEKGRDASEMEKEKQCLALYRARRVVRVTAGLVYQNGEVEGSRLAR